MIERDPTGRTAHEPGAKLDQGKVMAGLLGDFSLALVEVAKVATYGANKYSVGGWQQVPDGPARYSHAKWRHLLAQRHETHDPDTGLLHEAHEAWNTLARLELLLRAQRTTAAGARTEPADASPQHEARSNPVAGKTAAVAPESTWTDTWIETRSYASRGRRE